MKDSVHTRCHYLSVSKSFAFVLLIGLVACGRFHPTLELGGAAEKTVARQDDQSENIADEGEALLIPQSLEKARAKFIQALELNSENTRALFWRDTVDLILEFKGIVARIQPLYEATADGRAQYANLQYSLGPRYSDAQVRFLQAGRPDIHTPEEAAEFIDRMRLRVYKLRSTIRSIRDTEITLTLPKELIGDKSDQSKTACGLVSFGPIKFRFDDQICSGTNSVPFGVNRADFNSLLQILGYYQVVLDFWTAYRINPIVFLGSAQKPVRTKAEAEAKVRELFTDTLDGSASRPKPFIGLQEIGSDIYQALRYESENQKELCPAGYPSPNNRKGYLVSTGSCTFARSGRASAQRTMDVLEMFIAGQPVPDRHGNKIYLQTLMDDPPKSIKELTPLKFNKCGNLTSFNAAPVKKVYPAFEMAWLTANAPLCTEEAAR